MSYNSNLHSKPPRIVPILQAAKALLVALCAFLCAALLIEAAIRFTPAIVPRDLQILRMKQIVYREGTIADPLLGHALRSFYQREFHWASFSGSVRQAPFPGQDRIGYRVPRDEPDRARADIVALGDSHVQGLEVDEGKTWVHRLGALSGLRVANLGVFDYGTAQYLRLLREYGIRLHPRLVLVLLCVNEPRDDLMFAGWSDKSGREGLAARVPEFQYKFCSRLGLGTSPRICAATLRAIKTSVVAQALFQWSIPRWGWVDERDPRILREGLPLVLADLDEMRRFAESRGARFVVIINEAWGFTQTDALRSLTEALRREHLLYLDLSPAFKTAPYRQMVTSDVHWNETGHSFVAMEAHRFLLRQGLLPRIAGSRGR
ncbi:MAG TPA: hypothetical protein DCZ01_10345 [Elusimicrobia bacterium]|nr:hypothetical protein [Elusimicrobiota bacterium]